MKEYIKYPVRYESMGQMIFDADNNLIVDIRGWGRLQKLPNGEEVQDQIGEFVATAINEKLDNDERQLNIVSRYCQA